MTNLAAQLDRPFILVATPRSGSTVIQELFYQMSRFRYQGNLHQYFTVIPKFKTVYQISSDDKIYLESRVETQQAWCNVIVEKQRRLALLEQHPHRYLIKFFPSDIANWPVIQKHVRETYQPLFIDRRDRIAQFISYTARMQIGQAHFAKGHSKPIDLPVIYDPATVLEFMEIIKAYHLYRRANPGPVIFYEDFMSCGGDASALARFLPFAVDTLRLAEATTIPTPYPVPHEQVFANQDQWHADRQGIARAFWELDRDGQLVS